MKQNATSYQAFTAARKMLQDKLPWAHITSGLSGDREHEGYCQSYAAEFEDGKSVCASRVSKSDGLWPKYLYTARIGGKILTTDTNVAMGHGYGSEAKLIWIDLREACRFQRSRKTYAAIEEIRGLGREIDAGHERQA
ncbi:MAG: hypothetical protein LBT92_03890 [Rickettsiales bacterium]|jgi:hypothetical protein|nr:hypothetical protein [Rickettsiales bacterium]